MFPSLSFAKKTSTPVLGKLMAAPRCYRCSLMKPTSVLFASKKSGAGGGAGFEEKDVPADKLTNPIWDREGADFDNIFMGEDMQFLMGEDDLALMESLEMLSDAEVEMLAKDSEIAAEGKTKSKK